MERYDTRNEKQIQDHFVELERDGWKPRLFTFYGSVPFISSTCQL